MNHKGVTLIELLIAMVISTILIAGIYRVFISQQRSYTVQDQVVEMQQNVRAAINKMLREIRMVNFGRVVYYNSGAGNFTSDILPVNGFNAVLSMSTDNTITIVGGFEQIKKADGITPNRIESSPTTTSITLEQQTDKFDGVDNNLSIEGQECFRVTGRVNRTLTLHRTIPDTIRQTIIQAPTPILNVYKVQAVTYSVVANDVLRRDTNIAGGNFGMAENIESLQFQYFDASGAVTTAANNTVRIQVTVTARTKDSDPDYKGEGGYRRRQIRSDIQLRNMGRTLGIP